MVKNQVRQSLADALLIGELERQRQKAVEQLDRIKDFKNLNEILTYIADSSPKERDRFLKPWKTKAGKSGVGRKRNNDIQLLCEHEKLKYSVEVQSGLSYSDAGFLRFVFDTIYPDMAVEKANKKIRTIENRLSKTRKLLK